MNQIGIKLGGAKKNSIFALDYGPVAEWLGRALQKLVQRFDPARDLIFIRRIKGNFYSPFCFVSVFQRVKLSPHSRDFFVIAH